MAYPAFRTFFFKTQENGLIEDNVRLTLWVSPLFEESFVYDGESNTLSTWQII